MLFPKTGPSKATNKHKSSEMSGKRSKNKEGENLAEQYRDTYAQAAVFFRQLNVK